MEEAYERFRAVAQQQQKRGGFGGGGMPGGPRGAGMGLAGLVLLGGAAFVAQNALFNVDGGHRAIKYRRTTGVSKEIYSEGRQRPSTPLEEAPFPLMLVMKTY